MPIAGSAMLITSMDIDPADEQDFNRWYDKEHLAERVAIPGFLEARRLVAVSASPKYLNFYATEAIETFARTEYRNALQSQTAWSLRNLQRFRNPIRAIARITTSHGQGRGGAVAFIRIRPLVERVERIRRTIKESLAEIVDLDHVVSAHLLESDPDLSRPLPPFDAETVGSADWFVVVEGTDPETVQRVGTERFGRTASSDFELVSFGTYRHMWDLSKADLGEAAAVR